MQEEWRDIIIEKNGVIYDYTGLYQVSNFGRVRSLNYRRSNQIKILKTKANKGYLQVGLCKDSQREVFSVHRLVATVFIPNPDCLPEVNHLDEDKCNNNVNNLEWVTSKENIEYSKAKKVLCIETGQIFLSTNDIERILGLNQSSIGKCCRGERKTCGGYHWQYVD